jgi:hypothetical protein
VVKAIIRNVPGSIPGRVTGDFFRGIRQVHVPGVDSAFRNEYQDIPGGKDGSCVGLTTLMCRLSRNPGALTSQTPQGHVGLFRGYFLLLYYIPICLKYLRGAEHVTST